MSRWGAPFYHLHRADLHDVLHGAFGDDHITLGAHCVSVEQHDTAVTVHFADGRDATGDLLIGADGIHSVVREHVAGPDPAIWARQISWRGLAPAAVGHEIGLEVRHHSFWGPRQQFVCFYVAGGRMVNWVGNTQSDDDWQEESWSPRGDRDAALALYAGWHPEVRALIAGTERVFKWALFDRPPLKTWTRGRVTLLGDAAHLMLPYMAQGASQSIEDAFSIGALSRRRQRRSARRDRGIRCSSPGAHCRCPGRVAGCRAAGTTHGPGGGRGTECAPERQPGSARRPVQLDLEVRCGECDG